MEAKRKRRTISNLSREMKVSRPTIYTHAKKLEIELGTNREYSASDYDKLIESIKTTSIEQKEVKKENKKAIIKVKQAKQTKGESISGISSATQKERLINAKQEYDFNLYMINQFQDEARDYIAKNGSTLILLSNGALSQIPSINNIEKFQKLNIALSKKIDSLESDLDLDNNSKEESVFE